jgi:ABC-type branched-subunit amino acid transport system substrate-binding protein
MPAIFSDIFFSVAQWQSIFSSKPGRRLFTFMNVLLLLFLQNILALEIVKVGVLLPLSLNDSSSVQIFQYTLDAIRIAERRINDDRVIPGANVSLLVYDSTSASGSYAGSAQPIFQTINLIQQGIVALIGEGRDEQTIQAASLTNRLNIPLCTFTSSLVELSDKDNYPFVLRIHETPDIVAQHMFNFVLYNRWETISLIYTDNSDGLAYLTSCNALAKRYSLNLLNALATPDVAVGEPTYNNPRISSAIKALSESGTRIVLLCGTSHQSAAFIFEAYLQGYTSSSIMFIASTDLTASLQYIVGTNKKAMTTIRKSLIYMVMEYGDNEYFPWYAAFHHQWGVIHQNVSCLHARRAYSCLWTFAHGFRNAIANDPQKGLSNLLNLTLFDSADMSIFNSGVDSPVGPINYDQNGDFLDVASVYSYNNFTDAYQIAGFSYRNGTMQNVATITFPDGSTSNFLDKPLSVSQSAMSGTGFGKFALALAIILITACVGSITALAYNKSNPMVLQTSAFGSTLINIGLIFAAMTVFVSINDPDPTTCNSLMWFVITSYSLIFPVLLLKVWIVFANCNNEKLRGVPLNSKQVMKTVGAVLGPNYFLAFLWNVIDPWVVERRQINPFAHVYSCVHNNSKAEYAFLTLFYVFNGAMCLYMVYLAFKIKSNTIEKPDPYISIGIFSLSACLGILILVLYIPVVYLNLLFVVRETMIILASFIVYGAIFVPLFLKYLRESNRVKGKTKSAKVTIDSKLMDINAKIGLTKCVRLKITFQLTSGMLFWKKRSAEESGFVYYMIEEPWVLIFAEKSDTSVWISLKRAVAMPMKVSANEGVCEQIHLSTQKYSVIIQPKNKEESGLLMKHFLAGSPQQENRGQTQGVTTRGFTNKH